MQGLQPSVTIAMDQKIHLELFCLLFWKPHAYILDQQESLLHSGSLLSPWVLGKTSSPPKRTPRASGRGFSCLYFVHKEQNKTS